MIPIVVAVTGMAIGARGSWITATSFDSGNFRRIPIGLFHFAVFLGCVMWAVPRILLMVQSA
jgi:hypothetical protein